MNRYLTKIHKTLVADIANVSLGGGLELALACGYRVGEPGTRIC